jgi:Clp amino terminal domain, pathogenicity island component
MTPGPDLQQLIDTIRADAGSDDVLDQLATASSTITELTATSDAALGYFVDRARGAGKSWVEISNVLGVSKQAAHKRFADTSGSLPLDRVTPRTRAVLEAAGEVARARNQAFVGTEHLLLALYRQPEALATKLLIDRGITEQAVTEAVDVLEPPGAPGARVADTDVLPMTPRAAHVVRDALEQALLLGHNYIGTEHLLLSMYQYPGGVAAKVLVQLGLAEEDAQEAIKAALLEFRKTK